MASKDAQQYNMATIRQLLLAAFTPEELDRLFRFSADPQLQNVAQEFSPGDGLTMMADKAISYCQRHLLVPDMLAEVRLANPRQYAHYLEPETPGDKPVPSNSTDSLLVRARLLFEQGSDDEAIRLLKQAYQVHPYHDGIQGLLLESLYHMGVRSLVLDYDLPQAERAFEELLAIDSLYKNANALLHQVRSRLRHDIYSELARATPELETITSPIRLDLVRIPAGEFLMGSVVARDKDARDNELPPHTVHVPEFYIGQYPVTNIQYEAFVRATGHLAPRHWEMRRIQAGKDNHPVVTVSWRDAVAFCDWLSRETEQAFRLPTEAEWEKAARGTDGRIYPWGDEPPDEGRCNFKGNVGDTTTIDRYSPQGDSPFGCADMAGNVREWCQSLYRPYPYQADDGREDLGAKDNRVLRGGSWEGNAEHVRCASRYTYGSPSLRNFGVGFRVARGPLP
jgi:formylglycine-generating enzyme required for sulfatase activity